jgi:hypothetical protein
MIEAAQVVLRDVAIPTKTDFRTLVEVALFCGVGLFLSLSGLILDQYVPGEWF